MIVMPIVARSLILVNILVFIIQLNSHNRVLTDYALWPLTTTSQTSFFSLWQLITYSFLHGSITHLLFNMLALFVFGQSIEKVAGALWFIRYYFICVIAAALTHILTTLLLGEIAPKPIIGASGGAFGLLLAYAIFFPEKRLMIIFLPIPIKSKYFVALYGLMELLLGVAGTTKGIAHFAHLGGLLGGAIMLRAVILKRRDTI